MKAARVREAEELRKRFPQLEPTGPGGTGVADTVVAGRVPSRAELVGMLLECPGYDLKRAEETADRQLREYAEAQKK